MTAGLLLSGAALSAPKTTRTVLTDRTTMHGITFKDGAIDMAGNVYLPKDFDESNKHPAIVVVHPGGGVKEQTAGLYAQELAAHGFVTLAFDASHQGASGGMPRYLDDPMRRVGDIYSAATRKGWEGKATTADQLTMLDSVAKERSAEAAGAAPAYVP